MEPKEIDFTTTIPLDEINSHFNDMLEIVNIKSLKETRELKQQIDKLSKMLKTNYYYLVDHLYKLVQYENDQDNKRFISNGYKLVAIHECRYVSSLLDQSESLDNSEYAIEYIPNQWVKPKIENSKLFAFNSLDDVYKYFGILPDERFAIFECQMKNRVFVSDNIFDSLWFESFKAVWNTYFAEEVTKVSKLSLEELHLPYSFSIPICLCDEIMITERVE